MRARTDDKARHRRGAGRWKRCAVLRYETVLRACGFASLAIFCVMFGLSFLPRSAFQAGGFLTIAMTLVLVLKAYEARTKDHRRTEMWLYLPKESRPPEAFAQRDDSNGHARDLFAVRSLDRDHLHRDVDHRAFFLRYWTLVRDCAQPAGSGAVRSLLAAWVGTRLAKALRTGLNARPSLFRKSTLPTDFAGGIHARAAARATVLIVRPEVQRQPKVLLGHGFPNM